MNRARLIVAVLFTLLVGAAAGAWWSTRGTGSGNANSAESANSGRKVLYWHDPMVPAGRFDKPGKSPYMEMQLVPVYADAGGESSGVSVRPNVQQNLGIRLGLVEKAVVSQRLNAVGSVAFDERQAAVVQARVTGYITHLYVKAALDPVKRGAALAEVSSPEWLQAEDEYLALLDSTATEAAEICGAARQRLMVLGISESTIQKIERSRIVPRTTTLYSPIEGVVTELAIREGSAVMPGATLIRLNGLNRVWVNAEVPEAQVSLIPVDSIGEVRATAWPKDEFAGKVQALLPQVNAATRTLAVRLSVENPAGKLSPGMYVQVAFKGARDAAQLVIPSEALITTGERRVVILVREDGRFEPANVTVGPESGGKTPILTGLREGQRIVLSGQFLIDSEASLTSTIDRLTAIKSDSAQSDTPNDSKTSP